MKKDPPNGDDTLADDILVGAAQIAEYLYGDASKRRSVFHLKQKSRLPFFKLSGQLCVRKSKVRAYIEAQEKRGVHFPGAHERSEGDRVCPTCGRERNAPSHGHAQEEANPPPQR